MSGISFPSLLQLIELGGAVDFQQDSATEFRAEVSAWLARADPLPRMPDHIEQELMTWTLPVYFRLN